MRHPAAGGAERLGHLWRTRLARDGHEVRHLTALYPTADATDVIDGVPTIRRGWSAPTHYPAALAFYARHLRGWAEGIVEEVNTVPYFVGALAPRHRVVLLYHQLAREIWFYQTPAPVALIGYGAESVYTWLQSRTGRPVITVSPDSKRDLCRLGFAPRQVQIVREAIDNEPLSTYDPEKKAIPFTVLFHGSMRAMKRPSHAVEAFRCFVAGGGRGRLWISGGGDTASLRRDVRRHRMSDHVTFWGRVSDTQKLALMQTATVLVCTSVKEGWGLVVTEANSMGTPAIVYDVDGLRSSAGPHNWRAAPQPRALAARLHDAARRYGARPDYDEWCRAVLEDSRQYTPDASYADFRDRLFQALGSTTR